MNLTTPALLFPALSLLLLAYTNRFLTLAGLIRTLCKERSRDNIPVVDGQIRNLRKRIYLIKYMQFFGIASLFFCVISMFFLFLNEELIGEIVFGVSLVLMMASLGFSLKEIQISVDALDIQLDSCNE
ncbi:MAG: DUF2721 domain-containing protein [Spirochaetes bacterium]|jgi:O-antigen ligase|nr:DUF2721 domain-containing protein [Spirochaetota bacterium]